MNLHVLKRPDPVTLATCREMADNALLEEGWEAMTLAEFEAWKEDEISSGRWVSLKKEPVPDFVERWQFKQALLEIFPAVFAHVEGAIASNAELRIDWNDAIHFRRDHAAIGQIAAAFEIPDDQIDDLFRHAKQL
jgi:hypothetical protein